MGSMDGFNNPGNQVICQKREMTMVPFPPVRSHREPHRTRADSNRELFRPGPGLHDEGTTPEAATSIVDGAVNVVKKVFEIKNKAKLEAARFALKTCSKEDSHASYTYSAEDSHGYYTYPAEQCTFNDSGNKLIYQEREFTTFRPEEVECYSEAGHPRMEVYESNDYFDDQQTLRDWKFKEPKKVTDSTKLTPEQEEAIWKKGEEIIGAVDALFGGPQL